MRGEMVGLGLRIPQYCTEQENTAKQHRLKLILCFLKVQAKTKQRINSKSQRQRPNFKE